MTSAKSILNRIEALATISEDAQCLTRIFASPAMRRANDRVADWMREAGMNVREDAIGNLIGRYEGARPRAKTLVIGSHLDTVRDAGKFDGPLGVLMGIECVAELHQRGTRLPFAIEVIGFCDEEGVRYQSTYLGSRVVAGSFNTADLKKTDANGISMADAIRTFRGKPESIKTSRFNGKNLLGYLEVHIEQGPVLEQMGLAVGVVSAIAGQTRARLTFSGKAGHAGTTPMSLRKDALCAAAEFILETERFAGQKRGLVATVGQIHNAPNASNVIPGKVVLTLDVRHQCDDVRCAAVSHLREIQGHIRERRSVRTEWKLVQQMQAVPCDRHMSALLKKAARPFQSNVLELPSGAGHDAAVMAAITPAAMLFVRCRGGVSHHPDEFASKQDIAVAFDVASAFLQLLAREHC